ncbi:MAG: Microsomal dipeptidase [Firmicutes bacterium]|nr:Microsomal dipeptidase [Bacillota bacterium]
MKHLLTIDAHSDTVYSAKKQNIRMYDTDGKTHLDLKNLLESTPHIQFFALYSDLRDPDKHYHDILETLDFLYSHLYQYSYSLKLIEKRKDLEECLMPGKLGIIIAIEGSYLLDGNPHRLQQLHRLGIRCLSLTWNDSNGLSGGIGDSEDRGLSPLGKEIVNKAHELGIILDVSHISRRGFWDIIDIADKPIIATHSNCITICSHPRNLDDSQLKAIGELNGVVGINFVPDFLGKDKANVSGIVDHIEYVMDKAGKNCVGLGSDFDGMEKLPDDIRGCEAYYLIECELAKRNFSGEEIGKIMGGNLKRIIEAVI